MEGAGDLVASNYIGESVEVCVRKRESIKGHKYIFLGEKVNIFKDLWKKSPVIAVYSPYLNHGCLVNDVLPIGTCQRLLMGTCQKLLLVK